MRSSVHPCIRESLLTLFRACATTRLNGSTEGVWQLRDFAIETAPERLSLNGHSYGPPAVRLDAQADLARHLASFVVSQPCLEVCLVGELDAVLVLVLEGLRVFGERGRGDD
jgi:hypothetical protein